VGRRGSAWKPRAPGGRRALLCYRLPAS
jgi:hypothetical protein